MAKGKHATALFEVIHGDRRSERTLAGSGALRTPKWWFKRTPKPAGTPGDAPEAAAPHGPIPEATPIAPLDIPDDSGIEHTPSIPRPRLNIANDADAQRIRFDLTYTSA